MNSIILVGRLTRDPVVSSAGEAAVARFTVAVDRPVPRDSDGKRPADFIDCVAWRKTAEQVAAHLSKGRLVAVQGRLQISSYTGRDGIRRRAAEVVASTVRFLDGPRAAETEAQEEPEAIAESQEDLAPTGLAEGDVPF